MSGSFVRSTLMKFDCFFSFSSIKQCKWSDLKNEKCSWTLCMSKWKKKNKNSTWRYNWIMFMCIEYVYFLSTMLYLSSRYYRWKRKQTGKHFGNVSASYIFLRVPGLPLLLDISEVKKQKFEQGHEWWGSSQNIQKMECGEEESEDVTDTLIILPALKHRAFLPSIKDFSQDFYPTSIPLESWSLPTG